MTTIYKRFIEKEARYWRQIYKALQLLEYLVKHGSERVVDDARAHIASIKVMKSFSYFDEKGKDQGLSGNYKDGEGCQLKWMTEVRNRAKELSELLNDVEKIRAERKKARANRAKYTGVSSGSVSYGDSFSRGGGFGTNGYYGGGGTTNGLKEKTILLLISHPVDECMFFGPTLLNLKCKNDIIVLCLSNDNPTKHWDPALISNIIKDYVIKNGVEVVITFDNKGISDHLNHISAYNGARHFIKTFPETNLILYKLVTVNIIRKYISIFDSLLTYLNFISSSRHISSKDTTNKELDSSSLNNLMLFVSSKEQFYQTVQAIECHKSQLIWFRYLYLRFSRYMFINDNNIIPQEPSKDLKEWLDKEKAIIFPYSIFSDIAYINEGASGKIYRAKWKSDIDVALKEIKDDVDSRRFIYEFRSHKRVDYHDNILNIHGITKDPNSGNYLLVLQYANHGTLQEYLSANADKLDWENKLRLAYQLASGIQTLHHEGIIHRDLHLYPYNIRENKVDGTPEEYFDLYTRCWDAEPDNRPDIKFVVECLEELRKHYTVPNSKKNSTNEHLQNASIDPNNYLDLHELINRRDLRMKQMMGGTSKNDKYISDYNNNGSNDVTVNSYSQLYNSNNDNAYYNSSLHSITMFIPLSLKFYNKRSIAEELFIFNDHLKTFSTKLNKMDEILLILQSSNYYLPYHIPSLPGLSLNLTLQISRNIFQFAPISPGITNPSDTSESNSMNENNIHYLNIRTPGSTIDEEIGISTGGEYPFPVIASDNTNDGQSQMHKGIRMLSSMLWSKILNDYCVITTIFTSQQFKKADAKSLPNGCLAIAKPEQITNMFIGIGDAISQICRK
ncbi:3063_t:CDS:10 [Entrophospora sp. SA101]|nr:3063_t:CDS:10 [Entrophospora sp. SA101]